MALLAALVLASVPLTPMADAFVESQKKAWVAGPSQYLSPGVISPQFSADGRYLVWQDLTPAQSYGERKKIAAKIPFSRASAEALVRFDLVTGQREKLLGDLKGTIQSVEFVGPSGDVIIELVREQQRSLLFASVGQSPRSVNLQVPNVQTAVIGSPTQRRALYAWVDSTLDSGSNLTLVLITAEGIQTLNGPSGNFGSANFTGNTVNGRAVLDLSPKSTEVASTKTFEIDYETGRLEAVPEGKRVQFIPTNSNAADILISLNAETKSKSEDDRVLYELFAIEKAGAKRRLPLSRGVFAVLANTPDQSKVVYTTPDGSFLRELVPAGPEFAKKLRTPGRTR